ncbi:Sir2 silent information regulator family NAD-dependent deacetylase [Clostridium sp. MF28]|uniref:SIR2 family NAD-dependent protein deacylase n=1 Tax=Clostridium TaxID=1485 RepID=UPI000CF8CF89|nr:MULTISPECIES: Sir2 silent information regulator family NAD-dependent deacetylase [Clostridium]AVK49374.1 Sir2 silent information regulator family NAD-dependent deacetylase [Clostridium sp. MF28]PSM58010.1 Sir2 silent information regulator family NAD-dependent deacetylase [Clostridium diolis]
MFLNKKSSSGASFDALTNIEKLKKELEKTNTVIIGAGAGLSTSAGFNYGGERFYKYFSDFEEKYAFHDMYSGMFVQYESLEDIWAFWRRSCWLNRYMYPPKPTYHTLFDIVKDKDYFVVTTNIDHCFQKSGFQKERLFYTQGEYGLWQCSVPCHQKTYDNKEQVIQLLKAQGYEIGENNELVIPPNIIPKMSIPTDMIPRCPLCDKPMNMNLRNDSTFVEDEGWHKAQKQYQNFLEKHKNNPILFLDLGIGWNTPGIIKYPFWNMTASWPNAAYVCINKGEAIVPKEIESKSICIDEDIGTILEQLK